MGSNIYGQQCFFDEGIPTNEAIQIKIKGADKIIQIESNRESSYFLFDDGEVRACGRNDEGQLGDGTSVNTNKKDLWSKLSWRERLATSSRGPVHRASSSLSMRSCT